ncbi:MAG: protein kinase [Polyangiaceae bacterium]
MTSEALPAARLQALVPGQWLKGKWRVDALLGAGGVGAVYAVTHRNQGRAAIKMLHADLASDPEIVARFLREGYAANAVGHPGVAKVIDDDTTDEGHVFLVMELLDGETLEAHARKQGGKLPTTDTLLVIDAVLAVLEAAHGKDIVHRDLKTDNIFLCRDGSVKLLDFGLARIRETGAPPRSGTQLGTMMGTPGFMPPEQVRGRWDRVDARSDLWAVGATMYALLTGRRVHQTDTEQIDVFAAATKPVPSLAEALPSAPPDVVALVDRALALRPADRWASAAEMRAALASALPDSVRAQVAVQVSQRPAARSTTPPPPSVRFIASAQPTPPSRNFAGAPASTSLEAPRVSLRSPAPIEARVSVVAAPSTLSSVVSPMAPTQIADNRSPIEIAPNTYWVGMRDPRSIFHANPFLRIFPGASDAYNLVVDPGSSSDFAVVTSKISSVIGRMGAISGLFINHQDPDVGSSAGQICGRYAPRASIFASEATWRLIVHGNLPRERFVDTDAARRGLTLPGGNVVIPVPSPFCHFRGAVMLYDPDTRVLFSGDLFGGITAAGPHDLWADSSDWSGVRAFHQAYMPTSRAIAAAIRAIQRLDPPVEIIAPQHGRLLRGDVLQRFMQQLERLPVGFDIMDDVGDGADAMAAWSSVLNRVMHVARMILGEGVDEVLDRDDEMRECCELYQGRFEVQSAGRWVVSNAVRLLTTGKDPSIANPIRLEAVLACEELELPSPDVMLEGEAAISTRTV